MDSCTWPHAMEPQNNQRQAAETTAVDHHFETLCQVTGGVFYQYGPDSDRLSWSPQCRNMFGWTEAEMGLDSAGWWQRLHPQDRPAAPALLQDWLWRGGPEERQYRVQHRQGHYVWVADRSRSVFRADGPTLVLGCLQDVTRDRQRRLQLGLAQRAIDSSINGIAMTDLDGRLTYVNDAFAKLFGVCGTEELSGRDVASFWKHSRRAMVVLRALQQQGVWCGEMIARRHDGRPLILQLSAHVVKDDHDQPAGFMASFIDISQRRRAERTLQESEEKYRLLFSCGSEAIILFDARNSRIVDANAAALALYGYSHQEFTGLSIVDLAEEPDQARVRMSQVEEGQFTHFPLVAHRKKDGTVFEVEVSLGDFRWRRRRFRAGFFRDVSERRRIERLKDEMLSAVSHEMRTPLTAILGYADFLQRSVLPADKQQEYLQVIQHQGERLKDLVDNHLNLQRLRAGFGVAHIQPVAVLPLLHGVLNVFSRADDRGRFHIDCPAQLPPLCGDENQLYRALQNLLSNAVKYSPDGGDIVLGAYEENGRAVLYVRDQGIGILPQHQEKIFDRYFRVRAEGHPISGTGLGLTLVKEIIKAHNGQIWLESSPGCGSTFFLTLDFWN